ncbi:MAG: hypothetical protein AAF721_24520, partial [Myxococcota bacterium]
DAIDTKGLQYSGEVSNPGDGEDWIQFNIVPGQNDPYIQLSLDCDHYDLNPQPLRAELIDEDGAVLETVVCGEDNVNVLLDGANSTKDYFVRIDILDGSEHFDAYTVSIDGYCFQECNYQPYAG